MRYKKGSKVEVLIGNELPSGYWRCAEILCGNGHNYTVKCDMYQGATDEAIVERVSRKSIRPCPPSVGLSRNWIPGDIVEVLHNFAWKMATVSMVLDRNNFLVRFLGSSQEFKVRKFDIRVRQSWQDNKWTVIGNGPWNCEDGKRNERSTLVYNQNFSPCVKETYAKMNLCIKDDLISAKSKKNIQDPNSVSTRILKRESCYCHSQLEGHAGSARKFRLIGKGGKHYRVLAADPCLSPVKVDAVASPRKLLGHKHMSASLNNKTTGFPDMDEGRERSNDVVACSLAIGAQPIDGDNITSSVGSCSLMSNNSFGLPRHFSADPVEDSLSDAESTCQGVYKEGNGLLPSKEELTAEIHRLELHAYHRTMEALHASGPLSWEQETLATSEPYILLPKDATTKILWLLAAIGCLLCGCLKGFILNLCLSPSISCYPYFRCVLLVVFVAKLFHSLEVTFLLYFQSCLASDIYIYIHTHTHTQRYTIFYIHIIVMIYKDRCTIFYLFFTCGVVTGM